MGDSYIVCDLDGCLCDDRHRIEFALRANWDQYHARLKHDAVYEPTLITLMGWAAVLGSKVIFISGRPKRYKRQTKRWLDENLGNGHLARNHSILLRPRGNLKSGADLKIDLLAKYFGSLEKASEKVTMFIDDNPKVYRKLRKHFPFFIPDYSATRQSVRRGNYESGNFSKHSA